MKSRSLRFFIAGFLGRIFLSRIFFSTPLLFLFAFSFVSSHAQAVWNNIGFYHLRTNALRFSTSTQSIFAGNCSGAITVKTYNSNSVLINMTSNLTVNLSGPGTTTFYSDSSCTTLVTSVTISTGANSADFYFIDSGTGSVTITASATSYVSAVQAETLSTNPFVWVGLGSDANWNTAANWSGGAVPGSSNPTLFNGTCSLNCSPTMNVAVNVQRIRMSSPYAGTITQSSGKTVTLGSGGFVQQSGAFAGGDANITTSGAMVIDGGSFTSTSASLTVKTSFKVSGTGAYTHNSGTFVTDKSYSTLPLNPGSSVFKNVTFTGYGTGVAITGTMAIDGNLVCDDSHGGSGVINGGTINLKGNLSLTGGGWNNGGTALIRLIGLGSQTVSTTDSANRLPNFEIASSGTVILTGDVGVAGNYTYTSGTVTSTGSTLHLACSAAQSPCVITPGASPTYNNVDIRTYWGTFSLASGSTLKVGGNLTTGEYAGTGGGLLNGTIEVGGNFTTGLNFAGGTTLIRMVGTGTVSNNGGWAPKFEVNTSGTITLSGTNSFRGDWTYVTGTVVTTGSVTRIDPGATATISTGSVVFNDVRFLGGPTTMTIAGTMYVGGNLAIALSYTNNFNGGTIDVKGNATTTAVVGGTTSMSFTGTGTQTITQNYGWPAGNWTINKPSGSVVLSSEIYLNTTSQTVNVVSGSIDMAGYAFTMKGLTLSGNTLTKNGGVLRVNGTVAGTGSLYGGTVNP